MADAVTAEDEAAALIQAAVRGTQAADGELSAAVAEPNAEPPPPGQQGSMLLVPNLMLPDPIPLTEVCHVLRFAPVNSTEATPPHGVH